MLFYVIYMVHFTSVGCVGSEFDIGLANIVPFTGRQKQCTDCTMHVPESQTAHWCAYSVTNWKTGNEIVLFLRFLCAKTFSNGIHQLFEQLDFVGTNIITVAVRTDEFNVYHAALLNYNGDGIF